MRRVWRHLAYRRRRLAVRRRDRRIARTPAAPRDRPHVFYGQDVIPTRDQSAHGGIVKLQHLQGEFPNAVTDFNLLYLVSSSLPPDAIDLIKLARARSAPFVWNQNGVAYPAWHGPGIERINGPMAAAFQAADHVLFQSEFCRVSAERFLGDEYGPAEVLYNPVDTVHFAPAEPPSEPLTLLLGGNQYHRYRLEVALRTLALLPDARLLVSGGLTGMGRRPDQARRAAVALAEGLGVGERVDFIGLFTQREAPHIYRRAHLLLHTKVMDPCPGVVLEAMASGLPVVYPASGGTPELVGEAAGVGVPSPTDWQRQHPPGARELAEAVRAVQARLPEYRRAARERSARFDSRRWIERHRELFRALVSD